MEPRDSKQTRREMLRRSAAVLGSLGVAGCLRLSNSDGGNATAGSDNTTVDGTATVAPTSTPDVGANGTSPPAETATRSPTTPDGTTRDSGFDTASSAELVDWLEAANNVEGGVDGTKLDADGDGVVTVTVGAGDGFAFDPALLRLEVDMTVRWEWTGKGGAHSVVAENGAFNSGDPVGEAGHTFAYTFGTPGIYLYYCRPHKSVGMRGAVEVSE